ncbi:hypothetical protein O181_039561 [Austropuccinia psidii MF-1]|uniref:DDE Tnp4 domain-containing protein n=1 Tax=Austropuccinia psidii MF-1 TaxID=1389203 RepID=A0A9Q3D9W3_9BASI|nr:hypothetical protein [Austropuccinia psidii MF-1]
MPKTLFLEIIERLQEHNSYWKPKKDCCKKDSLSAYQKISFTLCQLAFGVSADTTDEYMHLGESTSLLYLKLFAEDVITIYGKEYLQGPNPSEIRAIISEYEQQGFPGCLGSLDCMHWAWKNFPQAWAGQFEGKEKTTSIILEAVASKSLQIWHAFFGRPGALNDINVLNQRNIFEEFLKGMETNVDFNVNGINYKHGYYLVDGIYPKWAFLIKSFPHAQDEARKVFSDRQESARKDIERAFGVLQARWQILSQPCWIWSFKKIKNIMYCGVILHNMIVKNRKTYDLLLLKQKLHKFSKNNSNTSQSQLVSYHRKLHSKKLTPPK